MISIFISRRHLRARLLVIMFVGITIEMHAQFNYAASLEIRGLGTFTDDLPFWMEHNQRGRIHGETNFLGLLGGKVSHGLGQSAYLEAAGGVYYEDAIDGLTLDELYLRFQNSWVELVVGKKHDEVLFQGLSATNGSILRSTNTRAMPGIQLRSRGPIMVLPRAGVGFEFSLEEFQLEEERYVSDTRLHHKSFHLVLRPVSNFQLRAGLQHYVQWAGTSPDYGPQPGSFKDYLRIFGGLSGGESAALEDQDNVLGNSLGSYEITLDTQWGDYDISLLWNSIFEDGSGMRLGNTPDGRYGVYMQDTKSKWWIQSLMYEFYYSKHHSHTTTGIHKYDNYFNNVNYKSGWTYYGRTVGVPFYLARPNGRGVNNNVFTAHHLGLGGVAFEKIPFRFLNSYRRNYGLSNMDFTYFTKYPPEVIFSSMLELQMPLKPVSLNLQLGTDFSNQTSPSFGTGLSVLYRL